MGALRGASRPNSAVLTSKPASGKMVASETIRPLPVAVARCS
jgi:hypothetical protein